MIYFKGFIIKIINIFFININFDVFLFDIIINNEFFNLKILLNFNNNIQL